MRIEISQQGKGRAGQQHVESRRLGAQNQIEDSNWRYSQTVCRRYESVRKELVRQLHLRPRAQVVAAKQVIFSAGDAFLVASQSSRRCNSRGGRCGERRCQKSASMHKFLWSHLLKIYPSRHSDGSRSAASDVGVFQVE